MQKHLSILLCLLALLVCSCSEPEPLTVVKRVLAKNYTLDLERDYSSKSGGNFPVNGSNFMNYEKFDCKLLRPFDAEATEAVVHLIFTDNDGDQYDCYVYLIKEETWKIKAFRMLNFRTYKKPLQTKEEEEDLTPMIDFNQFEEIDTTDNQLIFLSDHQLVDYFEQNKAAFDELKNLYKSEHSLYLKSVIDSSKKLPPMMTELGIVHIEAEHCSQRIYRNYFILKKQEDQGSLGFMYAPQECFVPKMNPDNFILIRYIEPDWFLYKQI